MKSFCGFLFKIWKYVVYGQREKITPEAGGKKGPFVGLYFTNKFVGAKCFHYETQTNCTIAVFFKTIAI